MQEKGIVLPSWSSCVSWTLVNQLSERSSCRRLCRPARQPLAVVLSYVMLREPAAVADRLPEISAADLYRWRKPKSSYYLWLCFLSVSCCLIHCGFGKSDLGRDIH